MTARDNFVVRLAADSDLDAAARVWHESAISMDGGPDVPSLNALLGRIQVELQSGWDLYVAARNRRILGLLAINRAEAILDQIFVLPAEQGKGVGTALMNVARREMPTGFTLRMAASNHKAKRFYEREGMKWLRKGVHPRTGVPVYFYSSNPR